MTTAGLPSKETVPHMFSFFRNPLSSLFNNVSWTYSDIFWAGWNPDVISTPGSRANPPKMPPKQTSSDGLPASNRFAILNLLDDVEEENDDDGDDDALSRYGNILQVTESRAYNLRDFGPQISRSLVTRHEPHSQHQREPTKPCENDNLCAYCQSIFMESQKLDRFGDGEEQQHHPNYKSFKEAVEMGCYICSLIGQKLELLVGEPGSTLSASGSVEKQFESLRYWMTHEELEPNVYFNYFDRNGKAHHRVLGLQLLPTSGKQYSYGR